LYRVHKITFSLEKRIVTALTRKFRNDWIRKLQQQKQPSRLFVTTIYSMFMYAGLQPFGPKHITQTKFAGLWKAEKKFKLV